MVKSKSTRRSSGQVQLQLIFNELARPTEIETGFNRTSITFRELLKWVDKQKRMIDQPHWFCKVLRVKEMFVPGGPSKAGWRIPGVFWDVWIFRDRFALALNGLVNLGWATVDGTLTKRGCANDAVIHFQWINPKEVYGVRHCLKGIVS